MRCAVDKVYALVLGEEDDPVFCYVGVSVNPEARFRAHLSGIADIRNGKQLYEWLRHRKERHTLRLVILDPEGELTEEEWRSFLLEEGHPIQNVYRGNQKRRSWRDAEWKRAWRVVNGL